MEDKRYPIELEVITPLSVGAGNDNDWVKGLDFVQKDRKAYVIDMQKAAADDVDVEALTQLFLKSDDIGISQLLGNKIAELSRYVFDLPAKTDNNIKTFLRTQMYDKPLVAGSSIKGSVRSALFNYLRTNEEKNEEVFGTMKDGTDLMRFIRIGDVEMPSTVLVNTKLFNLRKEGYEWLGGWKHLMNKTTDSYNPVGFNTLYECVAPGNIGLGNITLAAKAFDLLEKYGQGKIVYSGKKRELLNESISSLFQIINKVTKEYLQKERAFFEKYKADRSDEVLENIVDLLSKIPDDGSCCLLKMSAGVGFHSITGDWQFDDYDKTKIWTDGRHAGKKKYKSRKIAEYNHQLQLMGFVRLSALTPEEAIEKGEKLMQSHQNQQKQKLDAIILSKTKLQQKLAEEQAQQLADAEEKRKQEQYTLLLQLAHDAYNNELWDDAIAKADEAAALYPEKNDAAQIKADCQTAKDIANFRQQEKAKAQERLGQPLKDVISGKTSAGNLVGTTVKWLKPEGNSFGEAEQQAFLAEAAMLTSQEKKKLKSTLPDLAKVVGKDVCERIAIELGIV